MAAHTSLQRQVSLDDESVVSIASNGGGRHRDIFGLNRIGGTISLITDSSFISPFFLFHLPSTHIQYNIYKGVYSSMCRVCMIANLVLGVSSTQSARWLPDFTDDDSVYIVSQFNNLVVDIAIPPPSAHSGAPVTLHPDLANGTAAIGFHSASGAASPRRPHTQPELVLSRRTGALSQKWVWDDKVLVPKMLDDPLVKRLYGEQLKNFRYHYRRDKGTIVLARPPGMVKVKRDASLPSETPHLTIMAACCGDPDCERGRIGAGSICDNCLCGQVTSSILPQRSSSLASSITTGVTTVVSGIGSGIATGLEAINPLKLVNAISDQIDTKGGAERKAKVAAAEQAAALKKATPAPLQRWKIATEFQSFMDNILSPVQSEIEFQNKLADAHVKKLEEEKKQAEELAKSNSMSLSAPRFLEQGQYTEIWNDKGTGAKTDCSVWRPVLPPNHIFFGDYPILNRRAPTNRMLIASDHPHAFARPDGFSLVWREKKGKKHFYGWRPLPPRDYVAMGCVTTIHKEPPNPLTLGLRCVHKHYVRDAGRSIPLDCRVWVDQKDKSGTSGDDGGLWHTPAPLYTMIVEASVNQPNGSYYVFREPHEFGARSDVPISLLRVDNYQPIWSDKGSKNPCNLSVWRPILPDGYIMFGDTASLSYDPPNEKMVIAREHMSFARPLGYDLVWEMKKGDVHFYAWRPRPPIGYAALGLVSTIHHQAPSLDQVRCVERSQLLPMELKHQLWINSKGGGQDGVFWKVSDIHTFEINTDTHGRPRLETFRFPLTSDEKLRDQQNLEFKIVELLTKCIEQLDVWVPKLDKPDAKCDDKLSYPQIFVLLTSLDNILKYALDSKTNPIKSSLALSSSSSSSSSTTETVVRSKLQALDRKLASVKFSVKKYIFRDVVGDVGEAGEPLLPPLTIIERLDESWPVQQILPLVTFDEVATWGKKNIPKFKEPRKLSELIFSELAAYINFRFASAMPAAKPTLSPTPSSINMSNNNGTGTGNGKSDNKSASPPTHQRVASGMPPSPNLPTPQHSRTDSNIGSSSLPLPSPSQSQSSTSWPSSSSRVDAKSKLDAMTKLIDDIKLICEETDVQEVIVFYTRQYHTLFFAELQLHMPPEVGAISAANALRAVKFIQTWMTQLSAAMAQAKTPIDNAITVQYSESVEAYMDLYEEVSKEDTLAWVERALVREQKSLGRIDHDTWLTDGPLDLFTNINTVRQGVVSQFNLNGASLGKLFCQHMNAVLYYQQSLILWFSQCDASQAWLEDDDPDNDWLINIRGEAKSIGYMWAQINNLSLYDQLTEELKDSYKSQLKNEPEIFEEVEARMEEVNDGWIGIAVKCAEGLGKQVLKHLFSKLYPLFTPAWLEAGATNDETKDLMTKEDGIIVALSSLFEKFAKGIKNKHYLRVVMKTALHDLVSEYFRVCLENADFKKDQCSGVARQIRSDQECISDYFLQFADVLRREVIEDELSHMEHLASIWDAPADEVVEVLRLHTSKIVERFKDDRASPAPSLLNEVLKQIGVPKDTKSAILGPLGISDKPLSRGASLSNTKGAHLEILIRSGTALASKDADGLSDPYVIIHLLTAEGVELTRRKTSVVKGSLNPVWERQHFSDFDASHAANFANILFEVWDYDAGLRDDYMGQCSLNINEILKQQARTKRKEARAKEEPMCMWDRLVLTPRPIIPGKKHKPSKDDTVSGSIAVGIRFWPITSDDDKQRAHASATLATSIATGEVKQSIKPSTGNGHGTNGNVKQMPMEPKAGQSGHDTSVASSSTSHDGKEIKEKSFPTPNIPSPSPQVRRMELMTIIKEQRDKWKKKQGRDASSPKMSGNNNGNDNNNTNAISNTSSKPADLQREGSSASQKTECVIC